MPNGLRPFPKGVSGNPGGKRKEVAEILNGLLKYRQEAVDALRELIGAGRQRLKMKGEHEMLRDGLGIYFKHVKPESAELGDADPFANVPTEELEKMLLEEHRKRMEAAGAPAVDQ